VHLPELALRAGGERGLGGERGVGVEGQGVVLEDDADVLAVGVGDLLGGGRTREQNGHWNSLNSTMVTRASAGPLMASSFSTGTL
jgi:hypothetical protein